MSLSTPVLKVGVLAYGSLIDDPGPEIGPCIVSTLKNIETPFTVEYARSSQSRGGGPSLIPVDAGGAKVLAVIHVLKNGISVEQAKDWVWRREVRKYGLEARYVPKPKPGNNSVVVDTLSNFCGVQTVLYTRIGVNIWPLNANELARLAVESAKKKTVKAGKDGISYLLNARKQGIITPFTEAYERAVLRLTGSPDLSSALKRARGMGRRKTLRTP